MIDLPTLELIHLGRNGWVEGLSIMQAQDFFIQIDWKGKTGYVKLAPRNMTRKGLLWGCALAIVDMKVGFGFEDMNELVRSWRRTEFWTKFAHEALDLMEARDIMVL